MVETSVTAKDKSPLCSLLLFSQTEGKPTMKTCMLMLLLLLPLCTVQQHPIECYGHDFPFIIYQRLNCDGKVQQACYTRKSGEKGCTRLDNCSREGWNCCYTNLCNARVTP
ncbi:uncharacterized protein LOC143012907 [Genypterus blacodes]|uniref:uncharacterized protein LOC143012907 n=1 Tax=Genypterus blacodes TaxID=154954 RepID=UPI003F76E098